MSVTDLPKVLYEPQKAFKKIVENPKYWAVALVLILFVGIQIGFIYAQLSKIHVEQTSPTLDLLPNITNATSWSTGLGTTASNTFADFNNYSVYIPGYGSYSIFGNYSLQLEATGALSATLNNFTNADCGPNGFKNLSIGIKVVQPQENLDQMTLTLYSIDNSSQFQIDLLPYLAAQSWNNVTVPVGPGAASWQSTGTSNWGNMTALKIDANSPSNANITIRISDVFFHGLYQNPIEVNATAALVQFLQVFLLQFAAELLILTGLIYIIIKGLKGNALWKPIFIAVGFALIVLVVRGLVNIGATLALPELLLSFDLAPSVVLTPISGTIALFSIPPESLSLLSANAQAAYTQIMEATSIFSGITTSAFLVSYAWLTGLCIIIVGKLVPEFSLSKRILTSVIAVPVAVVLLLFLTGFA